jgi:hypothetical protein
MATDPEKRRRRRRRLLRRGQCDRFTILKTPDNAVGKSLAFFTKNAASLCAKNYHNNGYQEKCHFSSKIGRNDRN